MNLGFLLNVGANMLGNVLAAGFQTNPMLVIMIVIVVGFAYMRLSANQREALNRQAVEKRFVEMEQRLKKAEREKWGRSSPKPNPKRARN